MAVRPVSVRWLGPVQSGGPVKVLCGSQAGVCLLARPCAVRRPCEGPVWQSGCPDVELPWLLWRRRAQTQFPRLPKVSPHCPLPRLRPGSRQATGRPRYNNDRRSFPVSCWLQWSWEKCKDTRPISDTVPASACHDFHSSPSPHFCPRPVCPHPRLLATSVFPIPVF